MLVLSALCVLLPLVAALEKCDEDKAAALQAKGQLKGNVLDNIVGKTFWFVAVGADGSGNDVAAQVNYGQASDNVVPVEFVHYYADGTKTSSKATYKLDGNRLESSTKSNVYLYQCSENLIGGYRCQDDDSDDVGGNEHFVWAAWDKSEADIIGELESCLQKIAEEDADVTIVRRAHP